MVLAGWRLSWVKPLEDGNGDTVLEIPSLSLEQAKERIRSVWPDASFYEDNEPGYGAMLIAYETQEAQAVWDRDGHSLEYAEAQVVILWPLDSDLPGLLVPSEGHPVIEPLRGPSSDPTGITCTTTVRGPSGDLLSRRTVRD